MKYPHELVGWLYEVANGLGWQVPILDILNTEKEYPGLMDDVSIEYWQRNLIKGQMEGMGQLNGKRSDSQIDGQGER